MNAYKEAMTHYQYKESKIPSSSFAANEGAGVINEDMRVKAAYNKDMTRVVSRQQTNNAQNRKH